MKFFKNKETIKITTIFLFLLFAFLLGNFFQKKGEAWLAPQGNPPEGNIEFMKSCRWAIFDGSIVPPQSISTQPLSLTTVRIAWTVVPGSYSYKISAGQVVGGPYVEIGIVEHPVGQYDAEELTSGGQYYFVIQSSTDGSVWSEYSEEVEITMPVTPDSPTNLTSSIYSETAIDLSWTAPANDGGANITGYKIERQTSGGSWSTIVASTGNSTTTYRNTGLTENTQYGYRVSTVTVALSDPTLASTKYSGHCYTTTSSCSTGYTSILGGSQSGCATAGPVSSPYAGSGTNRYRILSNEQALTTTCSNVGTEQRTRQAQISTNSGTTYAFTGSSVNCRVAVRGAACASQCNCFVPKVGTLCPSTNAYNCWDVHPGAGTTPGCGCCAGVGGYNPSWCTLVTKWDRSLSDQTATIRWCCRN